MPGAVLEKCEMFSQEEVRQRPPGRGLALVEHACHLRDLDREVYSLRIWRILREDLPVLEPIDGWQMADERRYVGQDLTEALKGLGAARTKLLRTLASLDPPQLKRMSIFDHTRVSLIELVRDIDRHDQTHLQELDELLADLRHHLPITKSRRVKP